MNRRQIALKLALNDIGIPTKLDAFDDRLILQKTIYLLQQAGVPLGYHFSWYIRGPYCASLTSDAYESFLEETPSDWALSPELKNKIKTIKPLIDSLLFDSAKALENLASVLFLLKTQQSDVSNIQSIVQKMISAGKTVNNSDVETILKKLKDYGLI